VNDDFIIDVLNILPVSLLFIQESFQVLESDVHEVTRKYKLKIVRVSTVFFGIGYRKSSTVGIGVRDNFAT